MHRLQSKLFLYITLIALLPIFLISHFYYKSVVDKTNKELISASKSVMEQFDIRINTKTERLQNIVDVLFNDTQFQYVLREYDFCAYDNSSNEMQIIDNVLSKFLKVEKELETIVILPKKGGAYVFGSSLEYNDVARLRLDYGEVKDTSGIVSWHGIGTNISGNENNEKIVSSMTLRDTSYLNDMQHVADVYMVFSSNYFGTDNNNNHQVADHLSDDIAHVEDVEKIYIYNKDAELIYNTDSTNKYNILATPPYDTIKKFYSADEGSIKTIINGEKCLLVFYTDIQNNLKFVRIVSNDQYHSECIYIIYQTVILFIILFVLWGFMNFFVIRQLTTPLKDIVDAMKEIESENLDVEVDVHTNDEFGIIGSQFNKMSCKIKLLLERVKKEQEKRRESDIMMLIYQINPHFLYNTLASIRMKALRDDNKDVADMLLILGRFLKNTIVSSQKMICLDDEINNIKDYISLMQIRYKNQINAEIKLCESVGQFKVPSMLIQPIVENSITHGIYDKLDGQQLASLIISVQKDDNSLMISVYDNGKGMSKFEQEKIIESFSAEDKIDCLKDMDRCHIGLMNIHRRVTMLFGGNYGVKIKSAQGEYTEVTVSLPLIS